MQQGKKKDSFIVTGIDRNPNSKGRKIQRDLKFNLCLILLGVNKVISVPLVIHLITRTFLNVLDAERIESNYGHFLISSMYFPRKH